MSLPCPSGQLSKQSKVIRQIVIRWKLQSPPLSIRLVDLTEWSMASDWLWTMLPELDQRTVSKLLWTLRHRAAAYKRCKSDCPMQCAVVDLRNEVKRLIDL